jgi:hypothetical protein
MPILLMAVPVARIVRQPDLKRLLNGNLVHFVPGLKSGTMETLAFLDRGAFDGGPHMGTSFLQNSAQRPGQAGAPGYILFI